MVYYQILLSKGASNLFTIILPWVKYKYKRLPMGLCNSPDIFQDKINEIFRGMEFIRAYINDLFIIAKVDQSNHLNKLELLLTNIKANGIECSIEKSFFGQTEMEYLGFGVTQTGIRSVNKKVEAILNMTPPINQKKVRSFIDLLNYYKYMWAKRSHILKALTALT